MTLLTGLLSPPLFPATGGPAAFGNRRNPMRSTGISAECCFPKIMVNAAGETRNRTSATINTTWMTSDATNERDGVRLRGGGC
jgi:hypothetical protein